MDPEGGHQPLYNEDRTKALVANGEIYNFPGLFPELSPPHQFSTTSDSEAILHLYEDYGSSLVDRLDGMYAFALADGRDLYMARDPIGIKPLYYGESGGAFVFASELKVFPAGCTGIHEFPPGTWFHSRGELVTFYAVPEVFPQEAPEREYSDILRETLERAVTKRLMSDVPLGAFLSGGLDSSIIAALARKHMDVLHTFSVGVEGSNDLAAARLVARHLDTVHHEWVITREEVQEKLPEIIYFLESFDQDLVRSAIPCYFTSRLAADHVKVILTGEGADELFAGYTYYKSIADPLSLHRELRRSVASLHNVNLQRVDRMTMAHSIEGRVPFLDLDIIELGQLIPAELKLNGTPPVDKWILRKAFEDLLPSEVLWRKKEQFDEGSGTVDLLRELLAGVISRKEAGEYQRRFPEAKLRSPEECHYHRIFVEAFKNAELILPNVGRWFERPF
jgi:asparagine synthase (glutamine-hydrolysing)